MTIKKQHELGLWWAELNRLPTGEGATAGDMSKIMGCSRTTAQRKLRELVAVAAATEIWYVAKNGFSAVKYGAI